LTHSATSQSEHSLCILRFGFNGLPHSLHNTGIIKNRKVRKYKNQLQSQNLLHAVMIFSFVNNNPENIKHTPIIIHFNGKFKGNLAMMKNQDKIPFSCSSNSF